MFSSKPNPESNNNDVQLDSPDWLEDDFDGEVSPAESVSPTRDLTCTPAGDKMETPVPSTEASGSNRLVDTSGGLDDIRISPLPRLDQDTKTTNFVEEGMSCEAKTLYEGPKRCECCINWVGKTAEEVEEVKVLTNTLHGDAAVLTRQRNGHGGEDPFMLHSIVIQSPLIKKTLQEVLKGYPGVSPELDELSFDAPFEPLFHRWDALLSAAKNETSTETRKHLKVLRDVLEPEFDKSRNTLRECREHGVIKFDSLWLVFNPGDLIYSQVDGQECVMKLREAYYVTNHLQRTQFELQCENVDFDGSYFGLGVDDIQIDDFKGTAKTTDLAAIPLDLLPNKPALKEKLIARGKKFEQLRGYKFKGYHGPVVLFDTSYMQERQRTTIDERVIIDTHAYYQFTNIRKTELIPLEAEGPQCQVRRSRNSHGNDMPYIYHPPPPPPPQTGGHSHGHHKGFTTPRIRNHRQPIRHDPYNDVPNSLKKRTNDGDHHPLTEDQLLLCVPHVRGFVLRRKQWARFSVDGIYDIVWNEDAFESLVLPNQDKDLLLAFAEGQANGTSNFDDFIQGKGKGVVMLLSGAPGVGKTLTAESVAETMRVPLYAMSAGELGTFSENVERILKDVLDKCSMWKAVLLIDEADIFLEQRTSDDLQRNAMVSVFLRLLEYYEGIMFLTTNRVEAFDPAFESRIDVAFNYEQLSVTSRRQIWSNFIVRLPEAERSFNDYDLSRLADIQLNGRQIKSAVKTGQMLAARRRETVSYSHMKAVLELRAHLLGRKS